MHSYDQKSNAKQNNIHIYVKTIKSIYYREKIRKSKLIHNTVIDNHTAYLNKNYKCCDKRNK